MDQQNQYASLLGDTSDLYRVISVDKNLMASPGLISGIINLQLTRTAYLVSCREDVFGAISPERYVIRMVGVKRLVHQITLCRSKEFFKCHIIKK